MKRALHLPSIDFQGVLPYLFWHVMSGRYSRNCSFIYLFAMTLFSIMSSAFFSIPSTLSLIRQTTGKIDSTFFRIYGRILRIKTVQYPTDSLVINYSCLFQLVICPGVTLPLAWLALVLFLLIGSVVFITCSLVSLLQCAQLMTVVGNIAYSCFGCSGVTGVPWIPSRMVPPIERLHEGRTKTNQDSLCLVVTV